MDQCPRAPSILFSSIKSTNRRRRPRTSQWKQSMDGLFSNAEYPHQPTYPSYAAPRISNPSIWRRKFLGGRLFPGWRILKWGIQILQEKSCKKCDFRFRARPQRQIGPSRVLAAVRVCINIDHSVQGYGKKCSLSSLKLTNLNSVSLRSMSTRHDTERASTMSLYRVPTSCETYWLLAFILAQICTGNYFGRTILC